MDTAGYRFVNEREITFASFQSERDEIRFTNIGLLATVNREYFDNWIIMRNPRRSRETKTLPVATMTLRRVYDRDFFCFFNNHEVAASNLI